MKTVYSFLLMAMAAIVLVTAGCNSHNMQEPMADEMETMKKDMEHTGAMHTEGKTMMKGPESSPMEEMNNTMQ